MSIVPRTVVVLFLALGAIGAGCHRRTESSVATRRPIIIISIDTLRSDHLPAYGYNGVATPAIDALRADGILFTRAYSHCPLTLPSHATILSGRLPADNGIRDNLGFRWKQGVPSLAELLKSAGYATGAAVSSYALRSSTGISRGFDFYDDHFAPTAAEHSIGDVQRAGIDTERIAETWISGKRDVPFFFLLHLYEPHTPYEPPEPFKSRYPLAYDGEVATVDDAVGRFLAFLKGNGLYDRSSIILLSDHGEGLGEHGEDEHGLLLYRESLQVPLIVKLPDSGSRGTAVETPAQLVDVFATAAQLAGVTARSAGTSLLELREHPAQRRIFAETYFPRLHFGWSDLHSVIEANNHLIRGTRSELFDIVADPAERRDLTADRRRELASLRSALDSQMGPIAVTEQITPEEARKLAALGYIGSAANTSATDLPDTRDQLEVFREVRQAWRYVDTERYPEAIAASDELLKRNSQMSDVWQLRATAFDEMGRPAEAMDAARRGLAINPTSEPLLLGMARLCLQVKDYVQAGQYADLLLVTRPLEAHDIRARVALASGDIERSAVEARAALATGRESADVYFTLGRIAVARQDLPGALSQFEKAQKILERTGDKMRNLNHDRGFVLAGMGRDAEAEKAFREEIRLFPENAFAYKNLIVFYAVHGRVQDEGRLIDSLIQRYPSPASYAAVADALGTLGNRTAARKVVRDGLSRYPGDPELLQLSGSLPD